MSELIKNFAIDWKLLLVQAVNFFIVFFILSRFVFKPLLKVISKRKEEIEKGLQLKEESENKLKEIEKLKQETLDKAKQEALNIINHYQLVAKEQRDQIIKEALSKKESIINEAFSTIEQEKEKIIIDAYKASNRLIKLGIAKVIGKMTDEEKSEVLIQEALEELKISQTR